MHSASLSPACKRLWKLWVPNRGPAGGGHRVRAEARRRVHEARCEGGSVGLARARCSFSPRSSAPVEPLTAYTGHKEVRRWAD